MDSNLTYIITHVFLPPKLPQRDDGDASKSAGLIKELLAALKSFENLSEESEKSQWTPIIEMAETMLRVRDHSQELLAEELKTKLENLRDGGTAKWTHEAKVRNNHLPFLNSRCSRLGNPRPKCRFDFEEAVRSIPI